MLSRFEDKVFAIHISGVAGTFGGVEDNGDMFCSAPVGNKTSFGYDWNEVVIDVPQPLEHSVDIYSGEYGLSAANIFLEAVPELTRKLINPSEDAESFLAFDMSENVGFVLLPESGNHSEGDLIYVGNETIRLDNMFTSSGGGLVQFNVTRGIGLSEPSGRLTGEPVYKELPFVKKRFLKFFIATLDKDRNEVIGLNQFWSGRIEDFETDDCHNEIVLFTNELISSLVSDTSHFNSRRLPVGPYSLRFEDSRTALSGRLRRPDNYVPLTRVPSSSTFFQIKHEDFGSKIVEAHYVPVLGGQNYVFQFLNFSQTSNSFSFNGPTRFLHSSSRASGESEYVPVDAEVHEVLFWSRGTGRTNISHAFAGHVVALALSVLLSTGTGENNPRDPNNPFSFLIYDTLAKDVGLGVPRDEVDVESFVRCIEDYPMEVDQILLALNGDPIERRRILIDWLRSYRFFLSQDKNGKLACRRWGAISIDAICDIYTNDKNVLVLPNKAKVSFRGGGVSQLSSVVGKSEFHPGVPIQTEIKGTNTSGQSSSSDASDYYDFSMIFPSRNRWARQQLSQIAKARRRRPPQIRIRAPIDHFDSVLPGVDSGVCPSVGEYVRLFREVGDPKDRIDLMDPSGDRIDINSDDGFLPYTGIITSVKNDLKCSEVELVVLLLGWGQKNIIRLIAPSACIVSVSGSTVFINTTQLLSVNGDSGFRVGDDVRFVSDDGQHWCDGGACFEIATVSETQLTLVSGPVLAVPEHVSLIEVCNLQDFSNPTFCGSDAIPSSVYDLREYAFISDGDGLNGQDPDVYGL